MRPLLPVLIVVSGCVSAPSDTEWLAFSSGRSGDGDIYAIPPGSDVPEPLVDTEASEGTPRYDPGADRLVYSRFDSGGAVIMTGDSELFPDPNGDVAPVWSATGKIAFVVESDGGGDVYLANPDGFGSQKLTSDNLVERYPAWDPEGRRLVYAKQLESGWDLHILEVESRRESRVTFDGTYVGHPSWSPSGDRIAFDRMYGSQTEIAVLDLESGVIRRLTENDENDLVPSWSADGSRIAFAGVRGDNWDVWTVTTDGVQIRRVTTDPAFDGGPIFLPASAID